MSDCRQQVWIEAPVEVVWELIADVEQHPEWWPRVTRVECEGLEEGCTYREVVKSPIGEGDMLMDPMQLVGRIIDMTVGQRYFRSWLADSLDALRGAATKKSAAGA